MTKIILFGDNDTTPDAVKILDAIKHEALVDYWIFLGDGPYDKSGTKWVEMMKPFFVNPTKLAIVQGNHDHEESESMQTQTDIEAWIPSLRDNPAKGEGTDPSWQDPLWLTSKPIEDVYVIVMNSQDMDIEFKRKQYKWVLKQLKIASDLRAQGKVNWIINCVHKPWFTLKSSHSPYTAVREIYSEPFQKVGVDMNFHGHNHNDQAWFPMIAMQTEGNAAGKQLKVLAKDGKTLDMVPEHGWTTNICGHSGHEHNPIKEDVKANQNVMWANDTEYSYIVLETDPLKKTANVKWKDVAGKVLFEYNMTRATGGTPPTVPITPTPAAPPPPPPTAPKPTAPPPPTAPPGAGFRFDPRTKKWIPKLEDQSFVPPHDDPEPLRPLKPVIVIPPPPPAPAGTAVLDEHGTKMIYKITGKKVAMEIGTDHRNGQRYNNNHSFKNYMMVGYFKTGKGQEKLEMKTDGPNHGGCSQIPECMWYEPSIVVASGEPELGGEWPHPKNHNNLPADFKEKLKKPIAETWVGYAVIAYTNKAGNRVVEQWDAVDPFDASGSKPTNNWHLNLKAEEKGQIFPKEFIPRDLDKVIAHEAGFESEIRMHGGVNHDCEMKWCYVYEIVPPE